MLTQEQQIFEQVKKANNVLVTFPKDWSGDAVASSLAIFLFLKKMGKNVEIVAEENKNNEKLFGFLPGFSNIKTSFNDLRNLVISLDTTNIKIDKIKYKTENDRLDFIITPKEGSFSNKDISTFSGNFKYDLIITIDTPDLESLGSVYDNDTEFFYNTPIINIDHHSSNEEYGQINCVDLTAVAAAEALFSLMTEYQRDAIDEDIATCLLAGIISKTRSFKSQNITPDALSVSAQLISMGARRDEIVNKFYRSRSIGVLKLWGRILARLTSSYNNKLVWSVLSNLDFSKTETNENDLSEVIDELIVSIPEAKVIVIIYETEIAKEGKKSIETKALIYSVKNIDSLYLIKEFNPQGTKKLAEISIDKSIQEAEGDIINVIKNKLTKLSL